MTTLMPYRTNHMMNRHVASPFDDFFRGFFDDAHASVPMRVDVRDEGENYLLEADMPGVKKENLNIEVEDGVLTISAHIDEQKEENQKEYLFHERRTGSFSRSFTLNGIDEDKISATCEDGVLKLTLPKVKEEVKTGRKIEIQ